jgi:transposase
MNYIKGADRQQIVLYSQTLDNIIDKQNEVRAIDIFVNSLKMSELGFVAEKQVTGRPAYNPADLLKLYIYGYLNRTRSSREIEKETKRNIEVIWLINNLQPDHNTIANFRRDNPEPIRKVFEATVKVAKNRDLIGGKLIAGDSVKLRAQNSKKNNFNKEKLENQIDYLNRKIEEYDKLLESEDTKNEHVKQNVKTNKVSETSKKQETSKKSDIAQNVDVTETSDTSQKNKTNSDITKNVDVTKISEVAQNVDVTETSDTSQKNKNNSEITKNVDVTKISEVAQNVDVTETSDTSQKNKNNSDITKNVDVTKISEVAKNVEVTETSDTSQKNKTNSEITKNVDVTKTSDTSKKNKNNSEITKNVDVTKISEVAQNVEVTETSDTSQKNKNNSEITKNVDVTKISEVAQNVEVTETSDTSQKNKNNSDITKNVDVTKISEVAQNVEVTETSDTSQKNKTNSEVTKNVDVTKISEVAQNVEVTETSDTSQKNKNNSEITKNVDVTEISEVAQNVDVTETSDTSQKNKNNSEIAKNVDVTKISEVAQNVEVTETSDTSQKLETSQKTDIINTVNLEYLKDSKIESKKEYIKTKLQKHEIQRDKYRALLEKLTKTDETQISTSDPDSRNLPIKQQFTEVAYSVQATADAKNKILLDYEVTNKTDKAALSNSVIGAAKALGNNDFVALYDKGYFSAAEIAKCQTLGVTTMVSTPPRPSAAAVPAPDFWGNKFVYNKENDNYLCPNNQILTTNGKVYKSAQGNFKRYQTDRCIPCKLRPKCTTSQCGMRIIDRSEYADNVDINNKLVKENPQLYRLRQEIIEHPFGTMKRQWGFDHTIMKRGKERVSSDIGLIFVAYNLRRLINLLIKDPKTGKFHLNLRGIIKKLVQKILNSFRIELIFA